MARVKKSATVVRDARGAAKDRPRYPSGKISEIVRAAGEDAAIAWMRFAMNHRAPPLEGALDDAQVVAGLDRIVAWCEAARLDRESTEVRGRIARINALISNLRPDDDAEARHLIIENFLAICDAYVTPPDADAETVEHSHDFVVRSGIDHARRKLGKVWAERLEARRSDLLDAVRDFRDGRKSKGPTIFRIQNVLIGSKAAATDKKVNDALKSHTKWALRRRARGKDSGSP